MFFALIKKLCILYVFQKYDIFWSIFAKTIHFIKHKKNLISEEFEHKSILEFTFKVILNWIIINGLWELQGRHCRIREISYVMSEWWQDKVKMLIVLCDPACGFVFLFSRFYEVGTILLNSFLFTNSRGSYFIIT